MTSASPHLAALGAAMLMTTGPGAAQELSPQLQALEDQLPGQLINDPTRLDWSITGNIKRTNLKSADIPGGGAAVQVTLRQKPTNSWDVQLSIPLLSAIAPGEDITIAFYARKISGGMPGGNGQVTVRFQQNSAPYGGFGDQSVKIGSDWKLYEVTAKADKAIARNNAIVSIQLGGAVQTVAIGQAIVVKGAQSITGASVATAERDTARPEGQELTLPSQLQGLGTTINDAARRDWAIYGDSLTQEPITAGIPGGTATRFTVPVKLSNPWDAGINIPIAAPIAKGNAIRIALIARVSPDATDNGPAVLGIRIQRNQPDYEGFGDNQLPVGTTWQLIQLKTVADRDIAAGEAVLALHLGGAAQSLDIGPVWVIDADTS